MDLSSVFAVLQQADKQAQETNPYLGFQNIGDQLGQLVVKQSGQLDGDGNQRNGFGDILGAGLLTGLLSGGAGVAARGYQADQNKLAMDSLLELWKTGDVQRPEGMNQNAFSAIANAGKFFGVQRALDQTDQERKIAQNIQGDIARAKALAPLEIETALAKNKGLIEQERQRFGGGLGGLGNLPSALQDNAIQQGQVKQENSNVENLIDRQFEAAKALPSLSSAIKGTTASNEMQGIAITLTTALQKALGREMNAKEQERLQGAVPDWNDTADQIELKKQRFKDLFKSVSKATPLADMTGIGGSSSVGIAEPPQRPSITPEMAREILRSRGVKGY